MIRELEAREIEKIYREEMTGDFPSEELKPIDLILRLKAEGRYCAFGNFEGEKLTAYAFLIHEKDDPSTCWISLPCAGEEEIRASEAPLSGSFYIS